MLLSVKLPVSLGAKLAAAAARRRVSNSVIVRRALESALARQRGPRARTFGSVAGDLMGCLSGPLDLSTNRRHLRGYGR